LFVKDSNYWLLYIQTENREKIYRDTVSYH